MYSRKLSKQGEEKMHRRFTNNQEALNLIALINAEFQSDPMSVQCFDLRIVERVKKCAETEDQLRIF